MGVVTKGKPSRKPRDRRPRYQVFFALAINAWIPSWFKGGIFQGGIKGVCVPALNCYSCPSAMGACPIGAMQTFFAGLRFNLSVAQKKFGLYVAGFLATVGSAVGRMPCGWICPFGFVQELVHKVPSPKIKIPHFLTYFRYVVLATTVVALPLLIVDQFGYGQTWFCKWICPAGTLEAGIPLMLIKADLRPLIGFMYYWKLGLLALFLVWFVLSRRPFCRTVCPARRLLGPVQQGQPLPHGRRRREMHPLRQVHQGLPGRDQYLQIGQLARLRPLPEMRLVVQVRGDQLRVPRQERSRGRRPRQSVLTSAPQRLSNRKPCLRKNPGR